MTDKNYYEILGVRPKADGTAVHRSYWQLARKYQGLAPSDPRARVMLDDLNEAYGVLSTPALREQYDATYVAPPESAGHREIAATGSRSMRRLSVSNMLPWRRKAQDAASEPLVSAKQPTQAAPARPSSKPTSVDDLRLSTASIVGRWRKNAAPDVLRGEAPDTTLVDIFQSERDIEEPAEPLSAVLDVLRGSKEPASSR